MAYIDVVTLAQARNYMKIDPGVTEDDTLITGLIESALVYIEETTNIIVDNRPTESYDLYGTKERRIYDFPINSVVTPASADDYKAQPRSKYIKYTVYSDDEEIVLDVGYVNAADVPEWVRTVALILVDTWYKDDPTGVTRTIPARVSTLLQRHRRFTI